MPLLVQLRKGTLLRNALALLPLSGSFVLHLDFSSLEQNCGAEHLECLSSARQAGKKGGGVEGVVRRGFVQAVQDHQNASFCSPKGVGAPGSSKSCSLHTEEKQV